MTATKTTKTKTECDCCGKLRSAASMRAMSRDSNGDPDGGSMCFICSKELERGRVFNMKLDRYEDRADADFRAFMAEEARLDAAGY